MISYKKVIFVCNGNTCRSPMAAAVMGKLMPDMIVESRGMVVLFSEPYNPKAIAVALKHDIIIVSESTKQISNTDFANDCLVLTMDSNIKQKLYDEYSEAINVYTLGEFVDEPECAIGDPYGKSAEEYNECFEDIYRLVLKVVSKISE